MPEAAVRNVPDLPSSDWMRPLPPATRLAFQGGPAARAAAAQIFPLPDAQAVCRARVDGDRAGLWTGRMPVDRTRDARRRRVDR